MKGLYITMDEELKHTNGNINEREHPKITVVSGDGNIDISEVHSHLNIDSTSGDESQKKTIVIPPDHAQND